MTHTWGKWTPVNAMKMKSCASEQDKEGARVPRPCKMTHARTPTAFASRSNISSSSSSRGGAKKSTLCSRCKLRTRELILGKVFLGSYACAAAKWATLGASSMQLPDL
eukprot:1161047-Pelagomonas_calceolata.AAC.24